MPPKLTRVSGEQAIRTLEQMGFVRVRQRGSHVVMKKQEGDTATGCTVPLHTELAIGTIRGILKQAGVTPQQFLQKL